MTVEHMSDRHAASEAMLGRAAFFIALFSTALAMGAALAHALELPNKMGLSREAYFTVQQIYAGWDGLALLLLVELVAMLKTLVSYRRERQIVVPVALALLCLVAAQGVFWAFTFPVNQATGNWTMQPANWETLRRQWEYSHLAGAACQVLAMAALIVAVLRR